MQNWYLVSSSVLEGLRLKPIGGWNVVRQGGMRPWGKLGRLHLKGEVSKVGKKVK